MHNIVDKLISIEKEIQEKSDKTKVIAVSKTFSMKEILPLINHGHKDFGENKVQEAEIKWNKIKDKYKKIQLHMVGGLQSNKAKKAVKLFDYIHSLDNDRLATKISQHEKELNKKTKLFIQINMGDEGQKSGIKLNMLDDFYNHCTNKLSLNIVGLMCLPPMEKGSNKYFKLLFETAMKLNLKELSMGMSSDYLNATKNLATYVRIGSNIFGQRF